MRVLGLARTARTQPPYIDQLYTPPQRGDLLAQADYAVLAVPVTPATRGMVDASFLGQMKKTAYLIDCSGRPALFNYPDLVAAIEGGRLAGVALQPGGLTEAMGAPPADAPFWQRPEVVVAPCRGTSVQNTQKAIALFFDNLRRFEAGQPLLGLVDKEAGY